MLIKATVVVRTEGVFLILTDVSGAVNQREFWDPTMSPRDRGRGGKELSSRSELFTWETILDGVFRIDVSLVDRSPDAAEGDEAFTLLLPTGKLGIRTACDATPVLSVPPGTYGGVLRWDVAAESVHAGIATVHDYPEGAGPDGQIWLWPMGK